MPAVAIIGSVDSGHGPFTPAVVVTGDPLFTLNGIPVCKDSDKTVLHVSPNSGAHVGVISASAPLKINGVAVALVGDNTACGATIVTGMDSFTIN